MATIKKVEEFTKPNKKKGWKFFMDDGTEGYSHPDNPEAPWEYKEGDEVEFTVEKGEKYNLLLFSRGKKEEEKPSPVSETAKVKLTDGELLSLKMDLRKEVIRVIGQVTAAGRIEPKDMPEFYNEFYMATDASLDDLCK